MTTGVVLLSFGEPTEPDGRTVVEYLTRIFYANASLEDAPSEAAARTRARELAERRAPALTEEYHAIGGSPLTAQADAHARALATELGDRGFDVETYVGMQFTEPFVGDAVRAATADGVGRLVGLPVYPLCGQSTTVRSLAEFRSAVADAEWDGPVREIAGWHRHPLYNRMRAANVRAYARDHGIDLTAGDVRLVFAAHGTPLHYLESGSRYDRYVEEYCAAQAGLLGLEAYDLGWQNHDNRGIAWTEPAIEEVIDAVDTPRIVVEPVSFMHEQSETLWGLDVELREAAEGAGLEYHRVPVPHDDARFPHLLADLVEPFVAGIDPRYYSLQPCACREVPGAVCLNAAPARGRKSATGRGHPPTG